MRVTGVLPLLQAGRFLAGHIPISMYTMFDVVMFFLFLQVDLAGFGFTGDNTIGEFRAPALARTHLPTGVVTCLAPPLPLLPLSPRLCRSHHPLPVTSPIWHTSASDGTVVAPSPPSLPQP